MKINVSMNYKMMIAVVIGICSIAVGCNKTNNPSGLNGNTSTITDILRASTNATIFYNATVLTGLDSTFAGSGPFTVFVPTDSAFGTIGVNATTLYGYSTDSVKQLLLYHTLAGTALVAATFPSGANQKIITANGDSIFVSTGTGGLFVNGIPVESVDVMATNGVIQAITQRPLIPARGTLLQLIGSDTTFSLLTAAIMRASQGSTDINTLLGSGGPSTLLAPINAAFRAKGFNTVDDINNAIPDTLANLVLYHILPSRVFSSDISSGQSFQTAAQVPIIFTSTGAQRQVKGIANDTNADVLTVNTLAHNGVLFTIDSLLLH